MSDVFKFPQGYDVTVYKKPDIIACLDENVVDKDVVLEIIEDLEETAANFLKDEIWTGIPFIGNIRIPESYKVANSAEIKEIIQDAKDSLSKEEYVSFRRKLSTDIVKSVKSDRYYRYVLSQFVSKNRKFYNKIAAKKGDLYARIICYSLIHPTIGINSDTEWDNIN